MPMTPPMLRLSLARSVPRTGERQVSSRTFNSSSGDCVMSFCRLVSLRLASLLAVLFLLSPAALKAQTTSAQLSGVVADTTGARIPTAEIVLRNVQTRETRKAVSNDTGTFQFAAVPAGTYTVTVTMKGFETLITKNVELHPNDAARLAELHMKVGAETEQITVEGNTDIASSGERSSLITATDIQKLSTVGRDVSELLRTQAGFAVQQNGLDNSSSSSAEVAGAYSGLANYVGNGATANGARVYRHIHFRRCPGFGAVEGWAVYGMS